MSAPDENALSEIPQPASQPDSATQAPELGSANPVSEVTALEQTRQPNQPPVIRSVSLDCDYLIETVLLNPGDNLNFSTQVDDESVLTLTYSAVSDDDSVVTITADDDGIFTLTGVSEGHTDVALRVTDSHGLADEILVNILVRR